ncbi:MAG: ABC transporter ATP-binding protein [Ktedonobacteraceae bacterium]|nr:ABC transporter ATP-binding protein [Ktedonobacteraceae bacterium]
MSANTVLRAQHLKKYYRKVRAVEDVSFEVRQGEIFGFLGPNGAGKTTTIGMALGLIYPTAGEVTLFGERVTPMHNTALRRVGTLMGTPSLMQPISIRKHLSMLARLYPSVTPQRIDEVLDIVGLKAAANRAARKLSTGMKQRLGLALALLPSPELLILDEPTNGMDPAGMHEMRTLLRDLATQGTTILLSSHLLHEIEQICQRVAIIRQGQVVAEGEVAALLRTAGDAVRVRTADPDRAQQLLRELATDTYSLQRIGDYIEVRRVPTERVVEHLVHNGLTPTEVLPQRQDLEHVFLELTQEPVARR